MIQLAIIGGIKNFSTIIRIIRYLCELMELPLIMNGYYISGLLLKLQIRKIMQDILEKDSKLLPYVQREIISGR